MLPLTKNPELTEKIHQFFADINRIQAPVCIRTATDMFRPSVPGNGGEDDG